MSMDSIDFRNRNKFYCPDCNELLHPETEEYSIALANDKGVLCEDCNKTHREVCDEIFGDIFGGA